MNMKEAIAKKILNICKDRNISINKLATMCCLTQSTLQNIVAGHSNNPKIATIFYFNINNYHEIEYYFSNHKLPP